MVAFNHSILENWKLNGYRYLLVMPGNKYGVLRPLLADKPVKKGYTIEISEILLIQMAEEYFYTIDKDVLKVAGVSRT